MRQIILRLNSLLNARRGDEKGATVVEYAMMIALVAAVCIGIVTTLGGQVSSGFSSFVSSW